MEKGSSSEPVTPTSNETMKVKSSHASSEPVTPTSNEMMKPLGVLKVEAESSEKYCFEKIKGVLEKLEETGGITTATVYNKRDGTTVTVFGYFDPEKLKMELQNEAGDAIKSITDPTESIHSGRDGIVMAMDDFESEKLKIELENEDVLGQPQELAEMLVADSRNEILYHSTEKTTESSTEKPSRRDYFEPELGDVYPQFFDFLMGSFDAAVPEMRVPEAADSRTQILKHSELPMESRNYRSEITKPSNRTRWCCW